MVNVPTLGEHAGVVSRASRRVTAQPPASLVRALRHLLRPLVRLMLAHQITLPYLSGLLKSVYLEVGETELSEGADPPSASQLSSIAAAMAPTRSATAEDDHRCGTTSGATRDEAAAIAMLARSIARAARRMR